jgi:hypothetical protein
MAETMVGNFTNYGADFINYGEPTSGKRDVSMADQPRSPFMWLLSSPQQAPARVMRCLHAWHYMNGLA